jgi:protease IV
MEQSDSRPVWHKLGYWAFWIVLPLALGTLLAFVLVRPPQVGIIRFRGLIWSGSVDSIGRLLEYAQQDRRIRAVVLDIDSPGGEVTATEELYYRLLTLREHKPLVITVGDLAASGGYYVAAAGDHVYAKPASLVGNVGVISFLPSLDEQRFADEDYVSTGPFKFSGGSRGDFVRQIELMKLAFLEAVYAQRGDRLTVDREALAGGEVYMGLQAVRLGLIDELGSGSEAVAKAGQMARLAHYQVIDVNHAVYGDEQPQELLQYRQLVAPADGADPFAALGASALRASPAWRQRLYYLYVEPERRMR